VASVSIPGGGSYDPTVYGPATVIAGSGNDAITIIGSGEVSVGNGNDTITIGSPPSSMLSAWQIRGDSAGRAIRGEGTRGDSESAGRALRGTGLQADTTPKYGTPAPNEAVQSGTVQIAYRNIAINPDVLKVKVGSTIKWTNYDPVEHNVTSKGGPSKFASGNFGEGHTFEFKVNKTGVIHYECTIHPTTMNGTIEVVN